MTPEEALEELRRIWLAWAKGELDGEEFAGGVAETLEASGYPVIQH